jgi:hypothetical protein
MKEWNRFDVDTQEFLCTKYNITLTDFQTARTKRINAIKRMYYIGRVILLQSYQALKAYNNQPKKKRKRKKKGVTRDDFLGTRRKVNTSRTL